MTFKVKIFKVSNTYFLVAAAAAALHWDLCIVLL
jgi:hypothetical protein